MCWWLKQCSKHPATVTVIGYAHCSNSTVQEKEFNEQQQQYQHKRTGKKGFKIDNLMRGGGTTTERQ